MDDYLSLQHSPHILRAHYLLRAHVTSPLSLHQCHHNLDHWKRTDFHLSCRIQSMVSPIHLPSPLSHLIPAHQQTRLLSLHQDQPVRNHLCYHRLLMHYFLWLYGVGNYFLYLRLRKFTKRWQSVYRTLGNANFFKPGRTDEPWIFAP